jgi:cyd operon protein YbgT
MWYFTWILGVGLALAFGIINVMWLEARMSAEENKSGSSTDDGESPRS